MDFKLYSKYRTALMGLAMIMVIAYHQIGISAEVSLEQFKYLDLLCALCHGGTDIFLFFSGMGLYYSLSKGTSLKNFYKKRLIRLIPCYYIVILLVAIFTTNVNILKVLEQLSIIGFFIPGLAYYDWFIPSILLLYLIVPIYYKYFIIRPITVTSIAILVGLFLTSIIIIIQKGTIIQFFSRIPIFFIGFYFGYILKENKRICDSKTFKNIILFLSIIFLSILVFLTLLYNNDPVFLRKNGITHLPWIIITPGYCLVCSQAISLLDKSKYLNTICLLLTFLGSISLEIYLIHMGLRRSTIELNCANLFELNIITIALAYSLSKFVIFIEDNLLKRGDK